MFGKQQFIGKVDGNIGDYYDMQKEIGSGSFGRVYRVKNKNSGEIRACKQINKKMISDLEKLKCEINIMINADHPNIIKLFEIYEDTRYIYLIMEECTGGELFDRIIERTNNNDPFTEKEAAEIFKQIMEAINYCHAQRICHRDLKPENLLFLNSSKDSPIKVIDFGLSKVYSQTFHKMKTRVGTAYYVSPEVLEGSYDEKCDIWSAGVILYIILSGLPPFNGQNDNEIYRKIANRKFSFPSPKWDNISKDAKDLISHMLTDSGKRFNAEQVINHKWIKEKAPESSECILQLNIDSLKRYKNTNKLKKSVLTFIASRLKDEEIKDLKEIFMTIDTNKDGTLTLEEIKEGLSKINNKSINIEDIFKAIDTNGSGVIDYTEFIAATIDKKIYFKDEKLFEAFKSFDKDGSGKISVEEIKHIIKFGPEDLPKIEQLVKTFDINKDGEIDYEEFVTMMSTVDSIEI